MSDPQHDVSTPDSNARPESLDASRRAQHAETTGPATSRRTMLRAIGMVALVGGGAAALAACGASESSSTPATSTEPSAPASSAASSPSAAESSSAAPSESASSAAPTGPSVTTADVPVGSGIIMPDADFVVTQPEKGTYKAFSKICTHQSCPVTMISNREIVCPCHGSHFSISDGSVVSGPSQQPLPEAKTTVTGTTITITA